MTHCLIQAAFSLDPNSADIPSGPRMAAILGTTAHRLAEAAAGGQFSNAAEPAGEITNRWDELIGKELSRLASSEWLGRIPPPTRWRNYHRTRMRAVALVADQARRRRAQRPPGRVEVEKQLRINDPPFVGRIDRIETDLDKVTIVDIKSSTPSSQMHPNHRLQLLLYAALLRGAEDVHATHIAVQYLDGSRATAEVNWSEVDEALHRVTGLWKAITRAALAGEAPYAQPTADTCRYCPYKLVCPAFASDLDASAKQNLGVFQGRVGSVAGNHRSAAFVADPPHGHARRLVSDQLPPVLEVGDVVSLAGGVFHRQGPDIRTTWESTALVWRGRKVVARFPKRREVSPLSAAAGELEQAGDALDTG
jgi:RecB family exonuclease